MRVGMSASVFARLSAVLLLGSALAGCFGGGSYDEDIAYDAPPMPPPRSSAQVASALPQEHGTTHVTAEPGQQALQCVPYAREHSAIKIQGDANTWWNKASGKYERGASPAAGAVMVLFNYAASGSGHVAVVRRLVSSRAGPAGRDPRVLHRVRTRGAAARCAAAASARGNAGDARGNSEDGAAARFAQRLRARRHYEHDAT